MTTSSGLRAVAGAEVATVEEPTLGRLAMRFARTTVPTRLYQLLHLSAPLAADLAMHHLWRPAAWAIATTAFGAWGLLDRDVARATEASAGRRSARLVRVGRAVAGTVAVGAPAILLLELFARLLGSAPIS